MVRGVKSLRLAAVDFRYLLNRGYPRKTSLDLIGNRYGLSFDQRHLLHRGIFSNRDAGARRGKRVSLRILRGRKLAIDGYNVLITVEAGLAGRPLVSADDGFLRDISGLSANFRKTDLTDRVIGLVLETLREAKPSHSLFLFDAPISKSGLMAREVRERLRREGLPGDALALKVPENVLVGFRGIVATSDTAIIDGSRAVFDLAGYLIEKRIKAGTILTFPHPSRCHPR